MKAQAIRLVAVGGLLGVGCLSRGVSADAGAMAATPPQPLAVRPSKATPARPESDREGSSPVSAASSDPVVSEPTSADTSMFLANIEVARNSALEPDQLRLKVRLADGPFGELTRRGLGQDVRGGWITVRLTERYPASNSPVLVRFQQCSYLIDCETDAILALGRDQLPEQPSAVQLTQFVSAYISRKSLSRAFDIASEVALSREGDCTEHAVLLSALARRYRYAARVVLGFAVIRAVDRPPLVVGHAWTEIHDGHRWNLADAALAGRTIDDAARAIAYLPVQVVEREDAGFKVNLLAQPGCSLVERAEANY